mgnify:CR=1 FL=1
MVNGVNGNKNSLSVLLQQKQKKLESINQQKQAVQNALNMENEKVAKAQVDLGDKKISLSDAIVELQNHPFKGMKAPDAGDVKYEIKNDEGKSLGINQKQFDKDMAEFKKAEAEYKALEKNVDKTSKDLEISKEDLTKMMAEAEKVEKQLTETDADYEVTMGDIDALNKQIEEAAKTETLDVTLTNDKNNNTLVEATVNQLKDLQQKGLVDKNLDLENLKPEQLKNLSEAVVNADIKNGTVAEGTALDGTSKDYTGMKAGDGRKYTVAQMQEIAKALGTDATNDEASFEILNTKLSDLDVPNQILNPMVDLDKQIDTTSAPAKAEDKAGKDKTEIVFPRGIKWQGTEGNKLSDFGITDNGDGTYTASTGKTYTASEVNKYFREVENSSGNNYSKYLDKAEELGIDYNQYSSSKDLKEAVKAEEKRQKAEAKYSDEIKQYGIDTKDMSADDIKAAVKTAKKEAKETEVKTKEVEIQKAESAPKMSQPAVQYEVEDDEVETKEVEVQKAESAPKMSQPAVQYEVEDEEELSVDLNALANSQKANQAEAKTIKAEIELEKAEADLKASKDADEYAVKKEVVEDKKDKLADARKVFSDFKTSMLTSSTTVDDFLNGKGFEDFNAKSDAMFNAKVTKNFRDGANVTGAVDGVYYSGKQKISESGTKAYLINGEYYALRSDGMPDLNKKLNKAEFEK